MMKVTCLLLVAAVLVVVAPPAAAETPAISCGKVMSTLAQCFMYVMNGGTVPENCCTGVNSLLNETTTTAARRNVCLCLKSVTKTASPAAVKNVKSLPGKCGISLPYEITPAIDCNKVTQKLRYGISIGGSTRPEARIRFLPALPLSKLLGSV